MPEIKHITLRLPVDMWKVLRDMQTRGEIKSIHGEVMDLLKERITKKRINRK